MYDLHTDCHSGKKIGKLHYFVKRQEVQLSCLWDTDLWWYKQHVVPKHVLIEVFICFSNFVEVRPMYGRCK